MILTGVAFRAPPLLILQLWHINQFSIRWALQPELHHPPEAICAAENRCLASGFFFFYTLTRGVEVLFAAVSRWLVATARTSTCGTVELSKCPRTSHQSVAGKTHWLFATWSDIPRVDSVREIYVLHGRITNYSRLIKGLVHPNFEKIHLHRRLVRDGTFWRCSQW